MVFERCDSRTDDILHILIYITITAHRGNEWIVSGDGFGCEAVGVYLMYRIPDWTIDCGPAVVWVVASVVDKPPTEQHMEGTSCCRRAAYVLMELRETETSCLISWSWEQNKSTNCTAGRLMYGVE